MASEMFGGIGDPSSSSAAQREWLRHFAMDSENRSWPVDNSSEDELWKNASIYKLPKFGRDLNPKAFTPMLVSLGPYHHDNDDLRPLVVHKERALVHFVKKTRKPLDDLVNAVKNVLQKLQDSYYRLDEKWKTDKDGFLMLMITDGCFMLEVLNFAANNGHDYSPTDPFFSKHGFYHKMPYIRRDMLLIENQLPLLLLKILVDVLNPVIPEHMKPTDNYIHMLVLKFLTGGDDSVKKQSLRDHALDLFRHRKLWSPPSNQGNPATVSVPVRAHLPSPRPSSSAKKYTGVIRCARELHECGVNFKKNNSKSLREIKFDSREGILYLPQLAVDDATECTLLNVVAYEHLHFNISHDVTSYVCFMDEIISTANDVSLLHTKGIIQNNFGSDKNVAQLFNRISKEFTVDPESPLIEVRKQVQVYCNSWKVKLVNILIPYQLVHAHHGNPWAVYGAVLITLLAIIQTGFTIYQCYKPDKSS